MNLNWLALAVPFFVGLMYLEYVVSKRRTKEIYHFEEAIANINVGIAERLCDLFTTGMFFYFFKWIYDHAAIFHFANTLYTWILLFLFTDLLWYWYHRFGHEVNLFWAAHVVHHQSEDYNFTVSARITVIQASFRCVFWSFLPLLGFDPSMITILLLIHGAYPFFTHTQLVGKLGWLEYIFVTPSHHRVHHSSNPIYLDKNYGDVLIIWDKIFGTYQEETEQPVYGLTKPLNSYSFLWQHFHFLLEMSIAFTRAKSWRQRWLVVFGKPDHIDPNIRPVLERLLLSRQRNKASNPVLTRYIIGQTIMTLSNLFLLILLEHYIDGYQLLLYALFIFLSVIATGSMLEQRTWVFHVEFARVATLAILLWTYFPFDSLATMLLLVFFLVVLFYNTTADYYYQYVYDDEHHR